MNTPINVMPEKRKAFRERFYLYFPGYHVLLRAQIEGKITESALQSIIIRLQSRHFMLNVHIEIDAENRAWFMRNSFPLCDIQELHCSTKEEWIAWSQKEILKPFALFQGTLFRFLLLYNSSANITDLIITGHHSVCDGLSLVYLLHDIMELLADPNKPLAIEPAPSLDTVVPLDKAKMPFLIKKIFTRLLKLWESQNISIGPQDFAEVRSYYVENPIAVLPWELSPELTTVIRSAAREHGISVNSLLFTAFLIAQEELQDTSAAYYKKIFMPINIRKKVGIGDAVGLYASGNISKITINLHQSFWHNAKRVHSRLREEIEEKNVYTSIKQNYILPESIADARSLAFLCNLMQKSPLAYQTILTMLKRDRFLNRAFTAATQGGFIYAFVLTNLGQVLIPTNYGSFALKSIYLIPPIVFTSEKIMGIITYRGSLTGSLVFEIKHLPVSLAEKFLTRTKEILTTIIHAKN